MHKHNSLEHRQGIWSLVFLQNKLNMLSASIKLQEFIVIKVFYKLFLNFLIMNGQHKHTNEVKYLDFTPFW